MDLGFDGFEELEEKVEKMGIPLPTDLDYVKKYKEEWKTAYVSKEEPFVIESVDDRILASFSQLYPDSPEKWVMESGEWISPLKEGKEYIFGREPSFSSLQDLYYVSIKPNGEYDKRITGTQVSPFVSRIHYYVRDLKDEIKIARLGITPINIKFCDEYKSNVWL